MSIGVVNSQFTPQSKIYLLKGLEIDAMNNTFWGAFDTPEKQFNFFIDNYDHIVFENYTYQRKDGTVVVPGLYDDLRLYNYLIYQNGDTGNKSKWIYCFITSLGYLNDNATSISFETDVIQTWRFEIENNFMESYIAYEHRPQYYDTGDGVQRPCINTQPENLEIGTDLISDKQYLIDITQSISFTVIGMTCDMSGKDSFTNPQLGTPSQINYYILPFNRDNGADITTLKIGSISGQTVTISGLSKILDAIRKNEKLVGKCVSIVVTNSIPGLVVESGKIVIKRDCFIGEIQGDYQILTYKAKPMNSMIENDLSAYPKTRVYDIPAFIGFTQYTKLYTYPYSYLLISDNNGTTKAFKNELWQDMKNAQFICVGSPSSAKIDIMPLNYKVTKSDNLYSNLINLENSFESQYETSLPIISDTTALMLQSSRNSMNVGLSNIRRSNETNSAIASATGNALSAQTSLQNNLNLSVTARNTNLASNLNDLQNKSNMINASISAIGGLSGGIASALTGNIGGAVGSLVGAGLGIGQTAMQNQINTKQTNLQNANALANANAQASANSQSTAIGNQLRQLTTQYQNQTNIQNAMDSYNARIHDAQATADSIVTGSNDLMRQIALDLNTFVLYVYRPTDEYKQKLEKIWNMRGYATNTVDYPNLRSKTSWNYIQTVKCNIKGTGIDPSDLEKIKRVFDNGITLWHNKNVGDYSQINGERYQYTQCDKFGNYKEKKVH
ncbi:MAG: major tail protein [Bacteriophage sp.]|nr:MAG: major tail protein [Bacteriophage sp.]